MSSDDRLYSLGFFQNQYDYVDVVEETSQTIDADSQSDLITYYLTLDKQGYMTVRTVYTIWDVLGEIGGLIDMLSYMAMLVISIINIFVGKGLSKYLLSTLFFKQKKTS